MRQKEENTLLFLHFLPMNVHFCNVFLFIHAYLFIRFCLLLFRKLVKIVRKTLVFSGNSLLGTEKTS